MNPQTSVVETVTLTLKAEDGVCIAPTPLLVDTMIASDLQFCYAQWMPRELIHVIAWSSESLQLSC